MIFPCISLLTLYSIIPRGVKFYWPVIISFFHFGLIQQNDIWQHGFIAKVVFTQARKHYMINRDGSGLHLWGSGWHFRARAFSGFSKLIFGLTSVFISWKLGFHLGCPQVAQRVNIRCFCFLINYNCYASLFWSHVHVTIAWDFYGNVCKLFLLRI